MTPSKDPKKMVYGLIDPRNGEVRYIGASRSPLKRYSQHLSQLGPPARDMANWLNDLANNGMRPDLRLFTDSTESWREIELQLHRKYGATLLDKMGRRSFMAAAGVSSEQIGAALVSARLQAGLSQEDAAASLPMSQATISRYENGARSPDIGALAMLADTYGVSVQNLMGGAINASQGAREDARKAREQD